MQHFAEISDKSFHSTTKEDRIQANEFGLGDEEGGFAIALGTESPQQLSFVLKKRKSLREGGASLLYLEKSTALFLCWFTFLLRPANCNIFQ